MKKLSKPLALLLTLILAFSLTSCGGGDTTAPADGPATDTSNTGTAGSPAAVQDGRIDIGTWWMQYFDSSHQAVEDDPSYSGDERAHLRLENIRAIEERYGLEVFFHNMTDTGVRESVNTSILAGTPDMDIYQVDVSNFGLAAAVNGLAIDLRTILPPDHDLFNAQEWVTFLDIGDGAAYLFNAVKSEDLVEHTIPLAYNKQLLEASNLEDPNALWERGEWTWDKFIEYCLILTQDTDGDGQIDQWGFGGYMGEFFSELSFSNGTYVASNATENLSSPEVAEVMQLIYDLWNTHQVAYPYDYQLFNEATGSPWETMRYVYRTGAVAFYPISNWMHLTDYNVTSDAALPFDTVYVRWPVGPSGDKATNAGKNAAGIHAFMLPAGVAEPELVFDVWFDWWNWHNFDKEVRDDREALNWWFVQNAYEPELQDHNFSVMADCGAIMQFDLVWALGIEGFMLGLESLIGGTMTPAQVQETYRNQFQDGLSAIFR